MSQLSLAQARVVDPVITNAVAGYKNAAFMGLNLFPRCPVQQRGGKIIVFDRNDWRLYRSQRAPGTKVLTVDVNYGSQPFALADHNLDGLVPIELLQDAQAVPGINLLTRAVNKVQNALALRLEYDQAAIARTSGNYGSQVITYNGSTSWKNTAATPLNDIAAARQAILAATGTYPNTLILSDTAFDALRFHASLISRLQYTSSNSVTPDLIARLSEVPNVYVGAPTYMDDTNTVQRVWGNDAILAYVAPASSADAYEPSFGYTYTLSGYPNAETPWYDLSTRSWRVPYNDSRMPVLTSIPAGYLFQNAGQ
jgi:hypothetical protein